MKRTLLEIGEAGDAKAKVKTILYTNPLFIVELLVGQRHYLSHRSS